MSFEQEIQKVVAEHRDAVSIELEKAEIAARNYADLHEKSKRRADFLNALLRLDNESFLERITATVGSARPAHGNVSRPLTLHAAMERVLEDFLEGGLTAGRIAHIINEKKMYRTRDGRPVESNQIHARVGHYPEIFEKRDGRIFLAERTCEVCGEVESRCTCGIRFTKDGGIEQMPDEYPNPEDKDN